MPQADSARIERLGPHSMAEVTEFLDRDPVLNVFLQAVVLRDALAHPRDEFWGLRRGDDLAALVFLGMDSGLIAPVGEDPEGLASLAQWAGTRATRLPRRRHLVGTRVTLDAFEPVLIGLLPPPRLQRDQLYLAMRSRSMGALRLPELRPAQPADEALVFESGVALRKEELDEDPLRVDEHAYRRHVQTECRQGTTFLWRRGDELCFRATIGALSPVAAQISAVYTAPALRNQGIATRGVAELCRRLFERVGHVSLFVNEFNAPALAVYRKLGFRLHAPWRSVFWG